jgi:alkylated DNA repair dioxygenase AlkB
VSARPAGIAARRPRGRAPAGLSYDEHFVAPREHDAIVAWLATLHPIWEDRFTDRQATASGAQRRLLRPVYWLGNWQFACLGYYAPPKGVKDRCVEAEPFPPVLRRQVDKIEALVRRTFRGPDLPDGWHLNTCLVNFYGSRLEDDAWVDTARVGEHKDFEPGPVASISLGERALIQFVTSQRPGERDEVVLEQWLDDGSLQVFGGDRWKKQTFHRVQRVDKRAGHELPPPMPDFKTRRVNFTFRYVPDEHVVPYSTLSADDREDVRPYMEELAGHSAFFRKALEARSPG